MEGLHAKIDGAVWHNSGYITYTDTTIASLYRNPNLWTSQTTLVPMNLQCAVEDDLFMPLGYVEHVRLIRVDNYEIGDILSISPDEWKIFPFLFKDTANRNGLGGVLTSPAQISSGTLGLAVRYII